MNQQRSGQPNGQPAGIPGGPDFPDLPEATVARYAGFGNRGFRIAALFDADPARVGEPISGLTVRHIDEVAEVVAAEQIAIAVIATPAHAAQDVTDRLVAAGVTSILNFAPC